MDALGQGQRTSGEPLFVGGPSDPPQSRFAQTAPVDLYGADLVVAEGQSLGTSDAIFAARNLGIRACSGEQFVRRMPRPSPAKGRIAAASVLVLTLQTREHTSPRKGPSNVCNESSLFALLGLFYLGGPRHHACERLVIMFAQSRTTRRRSSMRRGSSRMAVFETGPTFRNFSSAISAGACR